MVLESEVEGGQWVSGGLPSEWAGKAFGSRSVWCWRMEQTNCIMYTDAAMRRIVIRVQLASHHCIKKQQHLHTNLSATVIYQNSPDIVKQQHVYSAATVRHQL